MLKSIIYLTLSISITFNFWHESLANSELESGFQKRFNLEQVTAQLLKTDRMQTKPLEKNLLEYFYLILNQKGIEDYLSERQRFQDIIDRLNPRKTWLYVTEIDSRFLAFYVSKVLESWNSLPPQHPGRVLSIEFHQNWITPNEIENPIFFWMDELYHSSREINRGVYDSNSGLIYLNLLNPNELHSVLAHELTHLFDSDLEKSKSEEKLHQLWSYLQGLPQKSFRQYSSHDQLFWGEYYFLKFLYHPFYSELLANLNACLVVTELYKQGVITQLSSEDIEKFGTALDGKTSCQNTVYTWNQKHFFKPNIYFEPHSLAAQASENYIQYWMQRHGF